MTNNNNVSVRPDGEVVVLSGDARYGLGWVADTEDMIELGEYTEEEGYEVRAYFRLSDLRGLVKLLDLDYLETMLEG